MARNWRELLEGRWSQGKFVCVGLDSEFDKIPATSKVLYDKTKKAVGTNLMTRETIYAFNRSIVEATADIVCAYKPNSAFYEAEGTDGIQALQITINLIHRYAPEVPVILDAKRGDIGNTNNGYVEFAFDYLQADAITVSPYLGRIAMQPFLDRADKGVIVLCRTSNPGASEFQDLPVGLEKLYRIVARNVAEKWNANNNCTLVVGATYPEELAEVRQMVGNLPILIPGVGFQQPGVPMEQQVKQAVEAGKDSQGKGMIVNSSRGIIFASCGADFADVARAKTIELHELINRFR